MTPCTMPDCTEQSVGLIGCCGDQAHAVCEPHADLATQPSAVPCPICGGDNGLSPYSPKRPAPDEAPRTGRWLYAKYPNTCATPDCGYLIHQQEKAYYMPSVGRLYCNRCGEHAPEPTEQEIREYRQRKADRRADRMTTRAGRLEQEATQRQNRAAPYDDYAFWTQPADPGSKFAKQRSRVRDNLNKAAELQVEAQTLRSHAAWTRQEGVAVKGDAEKKRQALRDQNDDAIQTGSRVQSVMWGAGVVMGVYAKSYRVKWDQYRHAAFTGDTFAVDKSHVTPE
jgi:hypothetical protein